VWQQLNDELSADGFTVIAVALDPDVEAVREWSAGLSIPVVIDADFTVAEAYGIVNVPASVWIDENDRIVRPADTAMADDRFRAFTNVDSSVHHDALRAWVGDDVRDLDDDAVRAFVEPPSAELVEARLHRQIALALRDRGDDDGMVAHLDAAETLAPWDWTIRRGNMPLRGEDPFGQPFFDFVTEFNEAGRPGYFRLRTGLEES
jgi:AhpC/TSA family